MSLENHVDFSVEAAKRAVAILVRVWRDLFAGATAPGPQKWVSGRRHVVAPFLEYSDSWIDTHYASESSDSVLVSSSLAGRANPFAEPTSRCRPAT